MRSDDARIWMAAVVAVLLASIGACNCNGSAGNAAGSDQEATAESAQNEESNNSESNSETGDEESEAESAAPAEDLYPGMKFGRLSPDERRTFVAVAKSELCPCPNAKESLHNCLQSKGSCAMAKRSATVVASAIKKGLNEKDVHGKLAEFVEKSRKVHEFELEDVPRKGPKDAAVRLVEFADFQCPHCKRAMSLMKEIRKKYPDQVAHYFKHFPLSGHGKARVAARAAVAANMQGKFWPMHDLLFKHQMSLSKDRIDRIARRIGLNFSKFKEDMESEAASKLVQRDRQEAVNAEVQGTPAVFINGRRYVGQLTEKGLSSAIESALKE